MSFVKLLLLETFSVFLYTVALAASLFALNEIKNDVSQSETESFTRNTRHSLLIIPVASLVRLLEKPFRLVAQAALLLPLARKTGSIPNLACRVCEYTMGRLSVMGLVVVILIHVSAGWLLSMMCPSTFVESKTQTYSESSSLGILEVLQATCIVAAFVMGFLVLPTLLSLNRIPQWCILLVLYPLYSTGDVFFNGPLSFVDEETSLQLPWSVLLRILGGFLAGRIMVGFFPDDDVSSN